MSYSIELSEKAERTLAAVAALSGVTVEEYITRFIEAWAANLDTSGGLDVEQTWFWAPEWQASERQADADAATGRGIICHDDDEMFAALDAYATRDSQRHEDSPEDTQHHRQRS